MKNKKSKVYNPIRYFFFGWTRHIQDFLYKRKIYWHNFFLDECCPFFECCAKTEEDKKIVQQLGRALLEQQEIVYLNLKDKTNGQ